MTHQSAIAQVSVRCPFASFSRRLRPRRTPSGPAANGCLRRPCAAPDGSAAVGVSLSLADSREHFRALPTGLVRCHAVTAATGCASECSRDRQGTHCRRVLAAPLRGARRQHDCWLQATARPGTQQRFSSLPCAREHHGRTYMDVDRGRSRLRSAHGNDGRWR